MKAGRSQTGMIMTPDERKQFARLNAAWRAGGRIDALRFQYNTLVSVTMPDGKTRDGWIVGASVDGPEPVYTVEAKDGSRDIECPESAIRNKTD